MNKFFKRLGVFFILGLAVTLVAACGGETSGETAPQTNTNANQSPQEKTEEPAQSKLSGSVVIDGSGTVYPFMARLSRRIYAKRTTGCKCGSEPRWYRCRDEKVRGW